MKNRISRVLATAVGLLAAASVFATTTVPVQLLNPAGSSSGQVITSTGPSSAPAWQALPVTVTGLTAGTGITLSGATGNITVSLTNPVSVTLGGTGLATLTQYNVMIGNGTSAVSLVGPSTSSFVLTSNGASAYPSFQAIPSQPGRLLNVQVFSSTGTYTPTANTAKIIVRVQAPGGGGGGVSATSTSQVAQAGGGSGGSYAEAYVTSGFSGVTVTIGATGTGGAAGNNNGVAGSTTSFGAIVSCPGGNFGVGSAAATPPSGQSGGAAPAACTVTSATTLVSKPGGVAPPAPAQSATIAFASQGGSSALGSGTTGAGIGNGAGGAGAAIAQSTSATAGSSASAGIVTVLEYN